MAKADGFLDARDRKWMKDFEREHLEELDHREDPATKPIMCKCGHTLAMHYQGDRAMPCGKCSCAWCTAPRAEDVRRRRAKLGSPELHPHPDFKKGRK
jgi:hypothetical protein